MKNLLLSVFLLISLNSISQVEITTKLDGTFGIASGLLPCVTLDAGVTTVSEYGNTFGIMLTAMPIIGLKSFPLGLYGSYRLNGYKGLMLMAGVELSNDNYENSKRKYYTYPMVGIKIYSYKIIPLDLRVSGNGLRLQIGFQIK